MEFQPGHKMDPLQLLGKRIGNFEVLELVGKGGMGFVFKARDVSLDREVALKVLRPELCEDKEFESRFVREARNAAKVEHPSIVQVYTAGKAGNLLFMAMQFIRGNTVNKMIEIEGKIPWPKALKICKQVLEALHVAHRHGFIHRDLKPTNVMVDDHGTTKIMDFGLMKHVSVSDGLTKAGVYYGTPEYSSPEQCQTQELDARSDIYSLGAVLYEMLTGRVPHVAETPLSLFKKIEKEDPVSMRLLNPQIPSQVSEIVRKMMAKDPNMRFQSAEDALAAVNRALQKAEVKRPDFIPYLIGTAAVVVAALVVYFIYLAPRKNPLQPGNHDTSINQPEKTKEKLKIIVTELDHVNREDKPRHYFAHHFHVVLQKFFEQGYPKTEVPEYAELRARLQQETGNPDAEPTSAHVTELIRIFAPDVIVTGNLETLDENTGELRIRAYKVDDGKELGSTIFITRPPRRVQLKVKEGGKVLESIGNEMVEALRKESAYKDFLDPLNHSSMGANETIFNSILPTEDLLNVSAQKSHFASKMEKELEGYYRVRSLHYGRMVRHAAFSGQEVNEMAANESCMTAEDILSNFYSARQKLTCLAEKYDIESDRCLKLVARTNPGQLKELNHILEVFKSKRIRVKLTPVYECPIDRNSDIDNLLYCKVCDSRSVLSLCIEPK